MHVGVVHFGSFTAGSHKIIRDLIEYSSLKDISLSGINWNPQLNKVEIKELAKDTFDGWEYKREIILSIFPLQYVENLRQQEVINQFDAVVVFGGNRAQIEYVEQLTTGKVLSVPISILNDFVGSQLTLGYDTALNVIVNNILKIKDTIDSLKYGKLRVFCAQIPGNTYNPLLENSAIGVDGLLIHEPNEQFWCDLTNKLQAGFHAGNTYTILVINKGIDPNEIHQILSGKLDIDFKWNYIDESQCVGPYPTATDRVLASKLSRRVISWIENGGPSSCIVVKDNKVIYDESPQLIEIKENVI
ncbi:6-phosphofructokinase [Ferdinandcohnia quinoae]|uniref:6-phosphofructokinase n=1 Tax=Fredinandcohnia quinoae TaxID=2918902 RepID=A0AAW5E398_9BACI|nr:6-phosphofructokinase [Fredinandcohnia sp. SECRCQ15]MCH1626848.1 6-phosphofructokinase [Fredinandcohnia sp. SECRCQ15]